MSDMMTAGEGGGAEEGLILSKPRYSRSLDTISNTPSNHH